MATLGDSLEINTNDTDRPNAAKRPRVENLEDDDTNPCEYAEELITAIENIQKENHKMLSQWMEEFSAGDNFERLCPSRLDELLREAYMLEDRMIQQKERLGEGLKRLTKKL